MRERKIKRARENTEKNRERVRLKQQEKDTCKWCKCMRERAEREREWLSKRTQARARQTAVQNDMQRIFFS